MRDNYNRLYELYDFINMLRSAQYTGITFDDIMTEFGWSRKTTERMLNVVQTMFCDALRREYISDDSRKKVYKLVLPDVSKLPPTFIRQEDILSLSTAEKMLGQNKEIAKQLHSLKARLMNINLRVGNNAQDLISSTATTNLVGPRLNVNEELVQKLQLAVQGCNKVNLTYKNKPRITCPLGFLHALRKSYLVAAKPTELNKPVKYLLADIQDVEILDDFFDADGFDVNEYAAQSFGVYTGQSGGYDIEWLVDKESVAEAKQYVFHPSQSMEENPDGTMTIRFHADGLREMAWHLFTWGGRIKPLKPQELIDEYKSCIQYAVDSLK